MNLETKITIYKFTPQLFTLTLDPGYTGSRLYWIPCTKQGKNKKAIDLSMAFLFGSPALCRVSGLTR